MPLASEDIKQKQNERNNTSHSLYSLCIKPYSTSKLNIRVK